MGFAIGRRAVPLPASLQSGDGRSRQVIGKPAVREAPSAGNGQATVKAELSDSRAAAQGESNSIATGMIGRCMIVSHRHRFIFAATPKTGTHAVRRALRQHLDAGDIEQVGLFVNKRFPYPELASIQHGHLTLAQVRPCLGDEAFNSYFKFSFVRNPFDRFVSYCAFMTRDDDSFKQRPRQVMRHILFDVQPMDHVLFQPQHAMLVDSDGRLLADYVGRTEQLQAAYDDVCTRLGLPGSVLERVNASEHGDYRQYYDQQLIDGVAALYQRDLQLFDYGF
jgi:hypothetical protein